MANKYDKSTSIYAVIGDPIGHSLSPFIHNRLYELYDINALYLPLHIKAGTVSSTLPPVITALNLRGFNITMPHKQSIIPLVNELSPEAELFESVNTVTISDDYIKGYNTDGPGYVKAIEEVGIKLTNKRITILGSGGVASTLSLQLSKLMNNTVTLLSIDESSAKAIVDKNKTKIKYLPWNNNNLRQAMAETQLLVNSTPLGMEGFPQNFADLDFLNDLPEDACVSDLIYAPSKTLLLEQAEKRGLQVSNGLNMLIWQAFISFDYFLGIMPDAEDKKLIIKDLKKSGLIK